MDYNDINSLVLAIKACGDESQRLSLFEDIYLYAKALPNEERIKYIEAIDKALAFKIVIKT